MPYPRQNLEFVGNLGRAAEMRYTPSGIPVTSFTMAVTRKWQEGTETKKNTIWLRVTAWRELAEKAANLPKGQQVLVKGYFIGDEGTGGPTAFTRQDGSPGAAFELRAVEIWQSLFSNGESRNFSAQTQSQPELDFTPDPEDIPF